MLRLTVPSTEYFDEEQSEFIDFPQTELELEHSLVSLSKWESLHEKPFLDKADKTDAEVRSYVEAMILTPEFPPNVVQFFTAENFNEVKAYIDAKMTATWFSDRPTPPSREIITSELIYYWMIAFNIPMECQHWHLNRLLTLVRVCNIKSQTPKKMSKTDIAARNRELNARRKAQFGTRG